VWGVERDGSATIAPEVRSDRGDDRIVDLRHERLARPASAKLDQRCHITGRPCPDACDEL
jgi:hypothetical protein